MKGILDGWLPAPLAEPENGNDIALVSEGQSESHDLEYEQALARFAKLWVSEFTGIRKPTATSPVEEGW